MDLKYLNGLAFIIVAILLGCSSTGEDNLAGLSADIPTIKPPNTATPLPTATRIPAQTPIPTETVEPTIKATIAPLPTATENIIPTIEPTSIPLTQTYATAFSVNGEPITVYEFGTGGTDLILIGGIHGGYEWNTVLLMYEMIEWITLNIDVIPNNIKLSIIPVMNPDGLKQITGSSGRFSRDVIPNNADPGRFNANGVDLNRNWNCAWEPIGFWRNQEVDAGDFVESEKEVQAMRFFIQEINPAGVIFYHSAAGSLYPGYCNGIVADGTNALVNAYETGSGFPQPSNGGVTFSYPVTGGAADYLATINIAAFEVELTNHQDTEFERNRDGLLAVFELLGKDPVAQPEADTDTITCPPEVVPFEITDADDPASYIGRHFDQPPFDWSEESGFVVGNDHIVTIINRESDYMVWLEETICRYTVNSVTSPFTEVSDILFVSLPESDVGDSRIIFYGCWLAAEYPDPLTPEEIKTIVRDDILAVGKYDDLTKPEPPTEILAAWRINSETGQFDQLPSQSVQCTYLPGGVYGG